MEHFSFMKECLKKFNYPKIHTLDDVEITEVFHKSNRQFLVGWILKHIDADYTEFVEKATKEDLAEILYCNGFCADSEKIHFINGEGEPETQLSILNTMFAYLDNLQEAKNNDETKPFSNEELKNFIDFDTNLFPMFGSRQVLSSAQRHKKIEGYQTEIELLQNLIASKTLSEAQSAPQLDPNLIKNLSEEMECLEINLPDFQRKILDVVMGGERAKPSQVHFQENLVKTLANCDENAAEILNLIKNMNVITNFKETTNLGNEDLGCNRRNNLMRQVAGLCHGVIAASHKTAF